MDFRNLENNIGNKEDINSTEVDLFSREALENNPDLYNQKLDELIKQLEARHNEEGFERYKMEQLEFAVNAGVVNPEEINEIILGEDGIWRMYDLTLEEYKKNMSNDSRDIH